MELRPEDYGDGWVYEIGEAAWVFADAIADIRHHEIGDGWDLHTDNPSYEIDRLRNRLDQMTEAVKTARKAIAGVERSARLRAIRRHRAASSAEIAGAQDEENDQ